MSRKATYARTTAETDISLALTVDGRGDVSVDTGFGLADHFLTLFAHWARFDLSLTCKGDLKVDAHHSVEDVGLCLGAALAEALGDRKNIARVGSARVPMDEALAEAQARSAKNEALQRAYASSGKSVDAFADMYGLDPQAVARLLAR